MVMWSAAVNTAFLDLILSMTFFSWFTGGCALSGW